MAKSFTISLNPLLIGTALAAFALGVGLGWWQPWVDDVQRTINITGSTTIDAQPDQYRFNPYIEVVAANEQDAKQTAIERGDAVAKELIALGVAEDQLTSDSSNYRPFYFDEEDEYRGNYYLEVVVEDEELSQNVFDALVASEFVTGGVDPFASFSEEKAKALEQEARTQAIADAKQQAERSAEELGLRVGKVVSVKDAQEFSALPFQTLELDSAESSAPDTNFYQGTDEYSFQVSATFELR